MTLRKKVLGSIKPKSINNQLMDGSTWLQMVEMYVKAINEGCVPNIQSSWAYICRQAAQEALDQAKTAFEKELKESVNFPMNHEDLENFINDQKAFVNKKFEKAVKGEKELIEEFALELNQYLEKRALDLMRENNYECR